MNRRGKIIVSVTGIFIVLLALVGLTYGYFLTRIQGNTSGKSISVTTANLALVYRDGSPELITSAEPIVPGKFKESKTFTVSNEGNATVDSYGVYLEDFSVTYANDGVDNNGNTVTKDQTTSFNSPTDMKMVVTCKSVNAKTGVETGTCDGLNGTLSTGNKILLTNSIAVGIKHEYTLTLEYVETGVDQSADMNKTINGKIQIYNEQDVVNIEGSVTGANAGDYVQINSVQKISQIVNGNYVLTGVEPGTHTLAVYSKDKVLRGSTILTINKGTANNVSGTTITVTDKAEKAITNITEINGDKTLTINVDSTIKEASPFKKGTLAYNILNNAIENKNGTTFRTIPLTTPGVDSPEFETGDLAYVRASEYFDFNSGEIHIANDESEMYDFEGESVQNKTCSQSDVGKYIYRANTMNFDSQKVAICQDGEFIFKIPVTETESSLSIIEDDYGLSYYYRGNVQDNYVNFAGMCWRIVRIEGDKSVKLILDDENTGCDSSTYSGVYSDDDIPFGINLPYYSTADFLGYNGSETVPGLAQYLQSFQTSKLSSYLDKLKDEEWCFTGSKINQPVLKCSGEKLTRFSENTSMKVGSITWDEAKFAGIYRGVDTYLMNKTGGTSFWLLSFTDSGVGYVYEGSNMSTIDLSDVSYFSYKARPAVTLNSGITVSSGEGTKTNPYVIK